MVIKETITFPAFTGTEERLLYIYLPKSYRNKPEKRYPVLYMFDGHNVFFDKDATYGKSWGMSKYLDKTRTDLMVVAMECNHDERDARMNEYSPFSLRAYKDLARKLPSTRGYGDQTLRFYVNVIKPMIDERFRTLPGRNSTFLMGSSMGGLMAFWGLFKFNRYFSKACALAPALMFSYDRMMNEIMNKKLSKNTELYMDIGSKDFIIEEGTKYCLDAAQKLTEKGIPVTYREIPGGLHNEATWEKQLPFCINMLMYDRR